MASPWKTLPIDQPQDGRVVWVRLNYWFGAPFLAEFNEALGTFRAQYGAGYEYPFWTISRWRSQ